MRRFLNRRLFLVAGIVMTAALIATGPGPASAGTTGPVTPAPGGYAHISHGTASVPLAAPPGYSVTGIDVSGYQTGINWPSVAAAGAKFAYAKATEGNGYVSPEFSGQYSGAKSVGLYTGAYDFGRPDQRGGTAEADFFLDHAGYVHDGKTLPPMLDAEWPYKDGNGNFVAPYPCYGLSPAQMVSWIRAFVNEVRARTGVPAVIYTATSWWNQCTGSSGAFGDTYLFIANYNGSPGTLPPGWSNFTFWQYSDAGSLPGDQDVFNGSLSSLASLAGPPIGHVEHQVQDGSGGWTGFAPLPGYGGAPFFDGPAATMAGTPDGSSQVMAVGNDGLLYHNLRRPNGSWTGWARMQGAFGAAVFAASEVAGTGMPDGSAQFLAVGRYDGLLYHDVRRPDGSWTGWAAMPGAFGASAFAASKMAIAGMDDGSSQVVAVGNDGLLYHDLRRPDGSWTGWARMQGAFGASAFAASDVSIANTAGGTTQVVAVGNDGADYHTLRRADGSWTGWAALPGAFGAPRFGGPAVTIAGFPNGTARVVAIGNTGFVYEDVRNTDGSWQGWTQVTTTKASDLAAAGMWNTTMQLVEIAQ